MRGKKKKKTGKDLVISEIQHHFNCIRKLKRSLRAEDPVGLGRRQPREPDHVGAVTERDFRDRAASSGWKVSKRGWPDFILRRGSRIIFVEVKTYPDTRLKDEQQQVAELLATAGFEVFRWDPTSGFQRIKGAGIGDPFDLREPGED